MSRTKVRKLWPVGATPEPARIVKGLVAFLEKTDLDGPESLVFKEHPATGRVIFHFEEGIMVCVESFDDGPTRRDKKNSKPRE